jgi:hypothetical protein
VGQFDTSKLVGKWPKLNVDSTDVNGQPLIDERHEAMSVPNVEAVGHVAQPEFGDRFEKPRVRLAVRLCRWALTWGNELILESEMLSSVAAKRLQKLTMNPLTPSLVQTEAEVVRHLKQHLVLPIDPFHARCILD